MNRTSRPTGQTGDSSLLRRLGWFALIWGCSVAALGLAALAMRLAMSLAGMTP